MKTYKGWGLIKTRATLLWEPADKILNAPLVELKDSKKYWTAWNPLRFIRASEVTSAAMREMVIFVTNKVN